MQNSSKKTFLVTRIAFFACLSTLLCFVKIPLIPPHKLDFSDSILLISAFMLGPLSTFFVALTRFIIVLLLKGSLTFGVGQLAQFVFSLCLVLPCAVLYSKKRTFNTACLAMLFSSIFSIVVSVLTNYFFLIPIYERFYRLDPSLYVLKFTNNRFLTDAKLLYTLFSVLPFNIIKNTVNCFLTLKIYKRIKEFINKINPIC